MRPRFMYLAGVALLISAAGLRAQFIWTGGGADTNWSTPGNWLGGAAPSSGGSALVAYATNALTFTLDTSPNLAALNVTSPTFYTDYNYGYHYETYSFVAPGPATLTLGSGGLTTDRVDATFSSAISFNLTAPQTWFVGDDSYDPVLVNGTITNNGFNLTKDGYGTLALNGSNNLTGSITLLDGTLLLGNNNALGTATLLADSYGIIQGTGALALANPISISNELDLDTYGGAMTLSGPISVPVGSYAYLFAFGKNPLNLTGTFTLDSTAELEIARDTTITLSGLLTSSGTPQSLYFSDEGTLVLNGSVSSNAVSRYDVYHGKLIFGSPSAIPTGGTSVATYGAANTNYSGYAGLGAAGVTTATYLATFNKPLTDGTIGFDNGITITDPIVLTGFLAEARLGSATTATLASTATITPQGPTYNFGGGGGQLTVGSDLTGTFGANVVSPRPQPLTLVLSGNNTYTGGTVIDNSVVNFASASAFPASGTISVQSVSGYLGRAYVGFGYAGVDLSTPALSTALGSRFTVTPGGSLVIGFDSPGVPVNGNTIDLSGFPVGTSLGTSTNLTLSGALVAPAGQPLGLAAVKDGHLTVTSTLTGTTGLTLGVAGDDYFADPTYYTLADPYNSQYRHEFDDGVLDFSDARSTITLTGTNSGLSGTVSLWGGRLEVGNSQALGTGTLQVNGDAVLAASAGGVNLANSIVSAGSNLGLDTTANNFTLSGTVAGYGLVKLGPGTVSLTGDVNLSNYLRVQQGTVDVSSGSGFYSDYLFINGAGTLNLHMPSPTVYALYGDAGGVINLDPGTTLSVNSDGFFAGTIAGGGGLAVSSGSYSFELAAANSYSGGTTVSGGTLLATANGALGSGPIVVTGGGLVLGRGVTVANNLTFTSGTLGGLGTFAPPGGSLTFGTSQMVAPGFGSTYYSGTGIGTLKLNSNVVLASGGTYLWDLIDATNVAGGGWNLVNISGALTITATSGAPFTLSLSPYGYVSYYETFLNFNPAFPYSWTILTAAGGITGFTPTNFVLDSTFTTLTSGHPLASFNVTQSGNSLVLNFSPVPEPSTYALLAVGLGAMVVSLRRRSRLAPRSGN